VASRKQLDLASLTVLTPVPTAAERTAQAIRDAIFEGNVAPGTALPETMLTERLRVSRPTVREALRMLLGDRLVTYEPNRGVFVRALTEADVVDIYGSRRMLELSALDTLRHTPLPLDAFTATLDAAAEALESRDHRAVGTENLRFHAEIVALHGSPRLDDFFRRLMTEVRLGFLALDKPETFHGTYHHRNRRLAAILHAGEVDDARDYLAEYLTQSAEEVRTAVAAKTPA
jgi:DNA-binding GntR family transcriptional regulator